MRRDGEAALIIFEWPDEPKPLGLRIDLRDTSRELYHDLPVGSFEDWLEYLSIYVMVSFDTGVASLATRIDRGDSVELVGT